MWVRFWASFHGDDGDDGGDSGDGGIDIGVDVCDDNILNIPLPRNGFPTPVYLGYRYPVDHNDLILVDKDQWPLVTSILA